MCGAEIAVHNGYVGRQVTQVRAVGAMEEMMEARPVVVIVDHEDAGLLGGGST